MFVLNPDAHRLEINIQPRWIRYMDKPHNFHFGPVTNPFPVFWLMLEGSRTIQIAEERRVVSKGDLIVFPPDVPYRLLPAAASSKICYLALSCTIKLGPFNFTDMYSFPKVTSMIESHKFKALFTHWLESVGLFDQLVTLHERHTDDDNRTIIPDLAFSLLLLRVKGAVNQWFAQIITELLPHLKEQPPFIDPRIVKVCIYMQEHVHETIPLEKLASLVFLSPSHLSYLFRTALGQPPAQYLRNYRIQLAKELLLQSTCSIGEISQRIGYGEQSEFSRTFRKATGQSPQSYRQECQHRYI